jgi:hypothetical protein
LIINPRFDDETSQHMQLIHPSKMMVFVSCRRDLSPGAPCLTLEASSLVDIPGSIFNNFTALGSMLR